MCECSDLCEGDGGDVCVCMCVLTGSMIVVRWTAIDDFQPEPEPDPSVVLHSAVLSVVSLLTEQANGSPFIVRQIHLLRLKALSLTCIRSLS